MAAKRLPISARTTCKYKCAHILQRQYVVATSVLSANVIIWYSVSIWCQRQYVVQCQYIVPTSVVLATSAIVPTSVYGTVSVYGGQRRYTVGPVLQSQNIYLCKVSCGDFVEDIE